LPCFSWDEEWLDPLPPSEQEQDEILIFGAPWRPPSALDEFYGGDIDDEQFLESLLQPPGPPGPEFYQRLEAERLMWNLMCKIKPPFREEAAQQLPYCDFNVAEAMLRESERSVRKFTLPEQSRELARLAEQVAKRLESRNLAKAWAMQAHAHCLQGNAERMLRSWTEAEKQFLRAQPFLVGLVKGVIHASFYQLLAALREEQGRLAEAVGLLREAEPIFWEHGVGAKALDCLLDLGFLHLQQNDPGRAMTVLTEARDRTLSIFPGRLARAAMGQAMCLAAAGLKDLARQVKAESLGFRKCLKLAERVKLEWLECRSAVHLGDLETAIPRLEAIRRWYLAEKDLARICLCSFDLACAYALEGRLAEHLPKLLRDVASQSGADEEVWALGALETFRKAVVDDGRDPFAATREAADLIVRRQKAPVSPASEAAE
jgi:hypothetical protein